VGNGTLSNFSGSGASYSFIVTATTQGAVTVSVPANAAQDAVGNGNIASGQFARTFSLVAPPPISSSLPMSTVAAFDAGTGTWYLRFANSPGAPSIKAFAYGGPGWKPVVGDWNGDGTFTIGVVDPSTMTWYLRNSNSPGGADITPFQYGAVGWIPIVGDWDGSGHTGIGVFDPTTATFYLRREVGPGGADVGVIHYGGNGWVPVVGDWDSNGTTTIGVVDPSTENWYLKNANTPGGPDIGPFAYGAPNWVPVAGDWNADGRTTIGVVDPSTEIWYLKNSNTSGAPDIASFAYGAPGWVPVPGAFGPHFQLLKAVGGATSSSVPVTPLSQSAAQSFLASAVARAQQDGVSSQLTARLGTVQVAVGTLGGGVLAQADPQTGAFILDARAAGYGWFVDSTPLRDEEFSGGQAIAGGAAAGRMDLLTAVLEEMGAAIGLTGNAFTAPLAPGARNVAAIDAAFKATGQ
jgi:hypothetical protein